MKYKVLLADADGTLMDFRKGESIAIRETLDTFGIPSTDENIAVYIHCNDLQWLKLERGETTSERVRVDRFADFLCAIHRTGDAQAMCADFMSRLATQRFVMDGAVDLLKSVSAVMPVYLVTNGISKVQRSRFKGCEIQPFITDLLICEEIGAHKPDPRMLYAALEKAKLTPKDAILLGDSVTADIAAAINAGVDSILFTNGRQAPQNCHATYCVKTLAEAKELILMD